MAAPGPAPQVSPAYQVARSQYESQVKARAHGALRVRLCYTSPL